MSRIENLSLKNEVVEVVVGFRAAGHPDGPNRSGTVAHAYLPLLKKARPE